MRTIAIQVVAIAVCLVVTANLNLKGQTLFESSDDDGIIALTTNEKVVHQIKYNPSSSNIKYGYYFSSGKPNNKYLLRGFLETKFKPNDDGIATLVKKGTLQPGVGFNGAIGLRLNDIISENNWSVLDFYIKPNFSLAKTTFFDSTRTGSGQDLVYEETHNSYGVGGLVNAGFTLSRFNVFLGIEQSVRNSNNISSLNDGKVMNIQSITGSVSSNLITEETSVKIGALEDATQAPFKIDLMLDFGWSIGTSESDFRPALFGYFRSDWNDPKKQQKFGLGISLVGNKNPSKVFSLIGYEFPDQGPNRKNDDQGIVFASIGYSIF